MRRLIELSENRTLIAGYSWAAKRSKDWIVYLPESGAGFQTGSRAELKKLIGSKPASRFNFLALNKPGIGPHRTDRKAFEASFRRDYRIKDALQTMKTVIPASDKICLIGYSEGAYLAPEVASLDKRVIALAMIGGGTRGWLKEELSNASGARERAAIRRQIREIRRRSRSTEKWNDFSFATWHSYREDRTLEALKKLRKPALAILGARDRTIDLKSTLSDLKKLAAKKPIHVEVFPRCGHTFNGHWRPVAQYLAEFLRAP
jgi:pimeloyl-ACP methyl ester carboxylesterase